MRGLKILITNHRFATRSGTEIYVRDLALNLLKHGHKPVLYSPRLGGIADEIRFATVPVVDDLGAMAVSPDIIHGHHLDETMTALLHFPNVPAIYVCHDWYSVLDRPPFFPRILRYVAVDEPCYDKLIYECAVPVNRVRLLHNAVDLERFKLRSPLPCRPRRALLYCNYTEADEYLEALRDACARAELQLDVLGQRLGSIGSEPEKLLAQYDIVFAKGRSALEALAVGVAVIIYCMRSSGPMIRRSEIEHLLPLNFGIRAMADRLTPEEMTNAVYQEIARYDAQDASEVTHYVRQFCSQDLAVDALISLYEEVITEYKDAHTSDANAEGIAAAAYVRWSSLRGQKQLAQFNNSPATRLKQKVSRIPLVGKASLSLARRLID